MELLVLISTLYLAREYGAFYSILKNIISTPKEIFVGEGGSQDGTGKGVGIDLGEF